MGEPRGGGEVKRLPESCLGPDTEQWQRGQRREGGTHAGRNLVPLAHGWLPEAGHQA